jgi:hypothetical protein
MKRTCRVCGVEKPLACFYAHKQSKGGRLRICRGCKISQTMAKKRGVVTLRDTREGMDIHEDFDPLAIAV